MDSREFIDTFNQYYPFERYILGEPQRINYFFDDLMLVELFIPGTEIKPITNENGDLLYWTRIDEDEIYIKCLCSNGSTVRLSFYDFAEHIQEGIMGAVLEDMVGNSYQDLYCECDDPSELCEMLSDQKKRITEVYGSCEVKSNFIITDTLNLLSRI